MLTVKYHAGPDVLSIDMDGHAGTAPKGQDLVCAAGSILAYTIAACINPTDPLAKIDINPGSTHISCSYNYQSLAQFDTVAGGFRLLAGAYPNHVKFICSGGVEDTDVRG